MFALAPPASNADAPSPEDAVKASFLHRFASFVEWPEGAFAAPDSPIRICVFGSGTMDRLLQNAVANQSVAGRRFEIASLTSFANGSRCQILYAAAPVPADTMHAMEGKPVLTVTDAAFGGGARGAIHFVVVDHRVRFHIDDASASDAHITISSRLLALALSVRRRTHG